MLEICKILQLFRHPRKTQVFYFDVKQGLKLKREQHYNKRYIEFLQHTAIFPGIERVFLFTALKMLLTFLHQWQTKLSFKKYPQYNGRPVKPCHREHRKKKVRILLGILWGTKFIVKDVGWLGFDQVSKLGPLSAADREFSQFLPICTSRIKWVLAFA